LVAGKNIISYEDDIGRSADQVRHLGVGLRGDQREDGVPVRRSNGQPAFAGLKHGIRD
jgi:hypothetical protein